MKVSILKLLRMPERVAYCLIHPMSSMFYYVDLELSIWVSAFSSNCINKILSCKRRKKCLNQVIECMTITESILDFKLFLSNLFPF